MTPNAIDTASERRPALPARPGDRLGIVAGGGDLPLLVARAAVQAGWEPMIITVGDGMAHRFDPFETAAFRWNRIGDAIAALQRRGVRNMVLCGTISVRPDFRSAVPSLRTLALLPSILRMMRGGDDSLLRAVSRTLAESGLEVLAIQDVAPELLAPEGKFAGRAPDAFGRAALQRAAEASRALGVLDVGQAVVASQDRVIALEGIEGTREMLARVADLRARGRIGSRERCVLFKGVKPGQDLRFDLPSIGRATVQEAENAGLAGIGLSAGNALVIGFEEVVAEAERAGLFLVGLKPGIHEASAA